MKSKALLCLILAACASEVGDERDVEADPEALTQSSNVNCVSNGQAVVLRTASIEMAVACGAAMQFQNVLFACYANGTNRARCDQAFGTGPLYTAALCELSDSGLVNVRNPPAGKLSIQKYCQFTVEDNGTVPPQPNGNAWYGERKDANGNSFFPIAKGVKYAPSSKTATDEYGFLSYSSSTAAQTAYHY